MLYIHTCALVCVYVCVFISTHNIRSEIRYLAVVLGVKQIGLCNLRISLQWTFCSAHCVILGISVFPLRPQVC